jgi:N4-gp56 family major capsid protein
MARSSAHADVQVQRWSKKFFSEYVRQMQFSELYGTDDNAPIQLVQDLTKQKGDNITIPLVRRLQGLGVTGNTTLKGNEEALITYAHRITVDAVRNGVTITELESIRTEIDLLDAARSMLKLWAMESLRNTIITSLMSPVVDGITPYDDATEDQKDAWTAANADRILFGSTIANNAANDHSVSLANVDNTDDVLSPGIVSLAKRRAKTAANANIRPSVVEGRNAYWIMLSPSNSFRDLKNHATMVAANRDAMQRGRDNPLFVDGDLYWDGVIIKEIPEIPVIEGVGALDIDVAPNFLLGAQAVGVAWAQHTTPRFDEDDYQFEKGVAIQEIRGVSKLMYNNVQHGLVTVYTAGEPDA